MIATIQTTLPCSSRRAWRLVKMTGTFLFITRGLLGFSGSRQWPALFAMDLKIKTRLYFFHILPGWKHVLQIIRIDEETHELYSKESGGPVSTWNHLIRIQADTDSQCRYMDQVDIRAGWVTPFIWGYANLFYRYRQYRWRRLVRNQPDRFTH